MLSARSCCPAADVLLGQVVSSGASTCAAHTVTYSSTVPYMTFGTDGTITLDAHNSDSGSAEMFTATLTCDSDGTVTDTVDVTIDFGKLANRVQPFYNKLSSRK